MSLSISKFSSARPASGYGSRTGNQMSMANAASRNGRRRNVPKHVTHYWKHEALTACGRLVYGLRATRLWNRINCQQCLKHRPEKKRA